MFKVSGKKFFKAGFPPRDFQKNMLDICLFIPTLYRLTHKNELYSVYTTPGEICKISIICLEITKFQHFCRFLHAEF